MKTIENYNDYLLDMILESIKNDETALVLSDRLKSYLEEIKEHPIAEKMLYESNFFNDNRKFKITLLDVVDKKDTNGNDILDIISFTQSNKAIENAAKELNITINKDEKIDDYDNDRITSKIYGGFSNDLYNKNRSESRLGKIINKLYPNIYKASGDPGNDIESFVNKYKALRGIEPIFELVNNDDINYWYNENRYGNPRGGTLYGSCMRYNHCYDYLNFYSSNPDKVSMLILKDPKDDTKIIGRALVWKVSKIGNTELDESRYFMDRIYYTNEYFIDVFKKHAKEKGWLYKYKQNMSETEQIIDSKTGEDVKSVVVSGLTDPGVGNYPFLDTLRFFDYYKGILSNREYEVDDYYTLTNTNGSADSSYWSDYYNEYINEDDYNYCEWIDDYRDDYDCFWSEYYGVNVANDYAEENGTYCNHSIGSDDWRKEGDYIEFDDGDSATEEYAERNLTWSDYSNEYFSDTVWSDYHESSINYYDAVDVYLNVNKTKTDWRVNDDDTWFEWDYDNGKYDNDITIEELEEYNDVSKDDDKE